jgi:hypothetical protein
MMAWVEVRDFKKKIYDIHYKFGENFNFFKLFKFIVDEKKF